MSFSDHKITSFTHKITDLPDQPNLPADELKARFDSSPEELRQSVNGICDDADRLDARVSGIITETFGDTIDKSMLSDELAAELDAKATKTELDSETSALDARLDTVETTLPQKVECYFGTYNGDNKNSQLISLGFTPQAVLILNENGQTCTGFNYYYYEGGLAIADHPCIGSESENSIEIVEGGFKVYYRYISNRDYTMTNNGIHYFIAFK